MRALLDADKTQWRELVGIISKGKNDEAEMAADQMRKLFIDQSVPREKLCTLFVESYDGLGRRSTHLRKDIRADKASGDGSLITEKEAIKNSLSDPRRSNEKITSLFDLLTTIFGARTDYQKKFIENGSIGVVVDILKQTSSIEGFEG